MLWVGWQTAPMSTGVSEGGWAGLAPAFSWRPSQAKLLEACAEVRDEQRHVCAPPGSGKTLVGIELARRLGHRTLVLSPTTAIRDQWADACRMFGGDPAVVAGTELGAGSALSSVTYQLLGNPGTAADELRAVARRLWVSSLAATDVNAADRVAALEATDPKQYRHELTSWVRRVRRSLLSADSPLPAEALLGERTSALLDEIAAAGYGTLVLDECHHLLDWWALVLAELIERMRRTGPLAVVGLTATLPDPEGARETLNYLRILGQVDVSIPMAALVAEGELAPWRDGAWFVTPTARELAFLDAAQQHLIDDLDEYLRADAFLEWAVSSLLTPALEARSEPDAAAWQALWNRDPFTARALSSWWSHRGMALPAGGAMIGEVSSFDADARLLLLWQFVHHPLCPAGTREPLTAMLAQHGMSLTSAGVRRSRTVNDIVAARSEAKAIGASEVLEFEIGVRGEQLCALVVLEQDRADAPAAARDALADGAGTALRVTSTLCANPAVVDLGVVTVTGRGLWVDAVVADNAAARLNVELAGVRWVRIAGTEVPRVVELVGEGSGWTSATRLAAAAFLLRNGIAHTLVATRALVGEGWNHPPLNVLVDLSEAASAASVTQLRGRAVRLDPSQPSKIASLWDIVVAHEAATGEWARARRRHLHWWGPDHRGQVVTGPAKASPSLERPHPLAPVDLPAANQSSTQAVADHAGSRAAWAALPSVGSAVPQLVVQHRSRRTVTARLPASTGRRFARIGAAGAAAGGAAAAALAGSASSSLAIGFAGLLAGVVAGTLAWRLPHRVTRQVASDDAAFWLEVGAAVRDGLDAACVTRLDGATVHVDTTVDGHRLAIAANGADATAWCEAISELLGPPGTPRWLLQHGGEVWRVPAAIGATRAAADAFHAALRHTLPAAVLLRGGTTEATAALLAAPTRHPDVMELGERWR